MILDVIIPNSTTTAIYAMMTACFLPFVFAIVAKALGGFTPKDNANPRIFLAITTGMASRANAVQVNSFESLPMFLAAVILAMLFFVPQQVVNNFAWMYVVIRIAYGMAYVFNLALFRSILWALSMVCIMMLFYVSMRML